jgi:glycosyltransferase involved in cell wall biosynthesis
MFSICIPQYNRTSFLVEACKSIASQTFRDIEICISDDCSTDGRSDELLTFLKQADIPFRYLRQSFNLRYDGNLRAAIGLATGRFCFLLGNDDALASPSVLEEVHDQTLVEPSGGVIITNYEDYATGRITRRVGRNTLRGSGPHVAVECYRHFSFVSGVVLDAGLAKMFATDCWDGSEFYQTFLATRMIASGVPLLTLDLVTVRKDIQIAGESVDSYQARPVIRPCPIIERPTNLVTIGPLVADAIEPYVESSGRDWAVKSIFLQLLLFTFPFWIFEYRRVQSWRYALGVCLAMRPARILAAQQLSVWSRIVLRAAFGVVTAVGLLTPLVWFDTFYLRLHRLAKSAGSLKEARA